MFLRKFFIASALVTIAPGFAYAANTINFSGEVTDQTCSAVVDGSTDPTVILKSVPVSELNGGVGKATGETSFTLRLTGCAAPSTGQDKFTAEFQATNPTAAGNLTNTASGGAGGVALQLLDAPGGTPVQLTGNSTVKAGDIVLASGQTSATYDYAVQYVSEAASVTPGPVLGSLMYTVRYE
ncbi:fimbrial protein [Pseudomonas mucidolens]|uniref:Major type 1 subunit fimbrin (Pilin) n=1 Tax=Pseudomonas mucidolens TaxID=46679 RepID=A0A1H2N633_9PSED|nr:fimbrial protein [Pseudomonas mucidolens]SDV00947.1 major type 1 subunit fimbrin (pilin) [Pseudomonas mucidolens]SQH32555.1 fimbrial subunit CupA1 [Pseudomonas mucidolens]